MRRAGELLKQIEPATGKTNGEGDRPFSRTDAAGQAGLSSHQQKQAVCNPHRIRSRTLTLRVILLCLVQWWEV